MRELFEEIRRLLEKGEDLVLVTVIAGSGSTPRGAGARMLVRRDGSTIGTIGGGAVEYRACRMAAGVLREHKSFVKGFRLDKGQEADIGMICGGDVTVYFQYVGPDSADGHGGLLCAERASARFPEVCGLVLEALEKTESSWLITDITDETAWAMGIYSESGGLSGLTAADPKALAVTRPFRVTQGDRVYYSEPLVRPGTVYIFGGGHVAQELVPVLSHLDFRCVVYDDREAFANRRLFPQASETVVGDFETAFDRVVVGEPDYVVIMTRGHQCDYVVQRQALRTPAHYIGVMGSRRKLDSLAGRLMEEGFTETDIERFHGPIGLAISAETPAEIAVSVAAELIRVRARREGRER